MSDMVEMSGSSWHKREKVLIEFRLISALIGYLRMLMNEGMYKHTYMTFEVILAVFKYGIKNVVKQNMLITRIKKKFNKKNVKEVKDLADKMGVMGEQKPKYRVTREALDEEQEMDICREYLTHYHLGLKW